jgi:hypothetical protein
MGSRLFGCSCTPGILPGGDGNTTGKEKNMMKKKGRTRSRIQREARRLSQENGTPYTKELQKLRRAHPDAQQSQPSQPPQSDMGFRDDTEIVLTLDWSVLDLDNLKYLAEAAINTHGMGHEYNPDDLGDCILEVLLQSNPAVKGYLDYGIERLDHEPFAITTGNPERSDPQVRMELCFAVRDAALLRETAQEALEQHGMDNEYNPDDLGACLMEVLLLSNSGVEPYETYGIELKHWETQEFSSDTAPATTPNTWEIQDSLSSTKNGLVLHVEVYEMGNQELRTILNDLNFCLSDGWTGRGKRTPTVTDYELEPTGSILVTIEGPYLGKNNKKLLIEDLNDMLAGTGKVVS